MACCIVSSLGISIGCCILYVLSCYLWPFAYVFHKRNLDSRLADFDNVAAPSFQVVVVTLIAHSAMHHLTSTNAIIDPPATTISKVFNHLPIYCTFQDLAQVDLPICCLTVQLICIQNFDGSHGLHIIIASDEWLLIIHVVEECLCLSLR